MKRFGLFILAVITAAGFSSCDDSDGDYPRSWAFATVKTLENNDYYFVLDDNKTAYPGDKSRIAAYRVDEDERAIIYFNLLKTPAEGYDYNLALYAVQDIYSGETLTVNSQEELDELADAPTSFLGARLNSNYLNLGIGFNASDLSKHTFKLVYFRDAEIASDNKETGYLNLEFRRDANGDEGRYNYEDRYVSFKLDEFGELLKDKKGIILRVSTRLNGVKYIRIPLPRE